MTTFITAVIERIPANSIFIGDAGDNIEEATPIAFFARVQTLDTNYPSSSHEEAIIAVPLNEFDEDLRGKSMEAYEFQTLTHGDLLKK